MSDPTDPAGNADPVVLAEQQPTSSSSMRWFAWALLAGLVGWFVAFAVAAFVGPLVFAPESTTSQGTPTSSSTVPSSSGSAASVYPGVIVVEGAEVTFEVVPGLVTAELEISQSSPPRFFGDAAPISGGRLEPSLLSDTLSSTGLGQYPAWVTIGFTLDDGKRVSMLGRVAEPTVISGSKISVYLTPLDAPGANSPYTSGALADLPDRAANPTVVFAPSR